MELVKYGFQGPPGEVLTPVVGFLKVTQLSPSDLGLVRSGELWLGEGTVVILPTLAGSQGSCPAWTGRVGRAPSSSLLLAGCGQRSAWGWEEVGGTASGNPKVTRGLLGSFLLRPSVGGEGMLLFFYLKDSNLPS